MHTNVHYLATLNVLADRLTRHTEVVKHVFTRERRGSTRHSALLNLAARCVRLLKCPSHLDFACPLHPASSPPHRQAALRPNHPACHTQSRCHSRLPRPSSGRSAPRFLSQPVRPTACQSNSSSSSGLFRCAVTFSEQTSPSAVPASARDGCLDCWCWWWRGWFLLLAPLTGKLSDMRAQVQSCTAAASTSVWSGREMQVAETVCGIPCLACPLRWKGPSPSLKRIRRISSLQRVWLTG